MDTPLMDQPFEERAKRLMQSWSSVGDPSLRWEQRFAAWVRHWKDEPEQVLQRHQNVRPFELDIIAQALRGPARVEAPPRGRG